MPSFHDFLHQAQQFDIFTKATEYTPPAAGFYVSNGSTRGGQSRGSSSNRGRGQAGSGNLARGGSSGNSRGGSSSGGGGRKPYVPRCQLCRGKHFADKCPQYLQLRSSGSSTAQLAQAFNASCNISELSSDWYVDSGASTHMAAQLSSLDSFSPYSGTGHVIVGNNHSLSISYWYSYFA